MNAYYELLKVLHEEKQACIDQIKSSCSGREADWLLSVARTLETVFLIPEILAEADEKEAPDQKQERRIRELSVALAMLPFLESLSGKALHTDITRSDEEKLRESYRWLGIAGSILDAESQLVYASQYPEQSTIEWAGRSCKVSITLRPSEEIHYLANKIEEAELQQRVAARTRTPNTPSSTMLLTQVMNSSLNAAQYFPPDSVLEYFLALTKTYADSFWESYDLPDTARVGGLPFGQWKQICQRAMAANLAYRWRVRASGLPAGTRLWKNKLIRPFSRRQLLDTWTKAGYSQEIAEKIIEALTLTKEAALQYLREGECPCPYYIEFGSQSLLVLSSGGLPNPYAMMHQYLIRNHGRDWSTAQALRENMFRKELIEAFPKDRFAVLDQGRKVKRVDGTDLTDIDTIVIDKVSGDLALVQLKWQNLYGRSFRQRQSQAKNSSLQADHWAREVSSWIANRSCREVSKLLGIKLTRQNDQPPIIYVISKYVAEPARQNLSNPGDYTWLSLGELKLALTQMSSNNPLRSLRQPTKPSENSDLSDNDGEPFRLKAPNLDIEITFKRSRG